MVTYVAYTCRTTEEIRRPELGIGAQDCDISWFLDKYTAGRAAAEYYSDEQDLPAADRPGLRQALTLCRRIRACLLVSRIELLPFDDPVFISDLGNLDVKVAATPDASTADLRIHARLLVQERNFVRRHIIDDVSRPDASQGEQKSTERDNIIQIAEIVLPLRRSGATMDNIASTLNRMGLTTARGTAWRAQHVSKILAKSAGNIVRIRS